MADVDMEYEYAERTESVDTTGSAGDPSDEPCNNFRLDTTRSFGMCKCGHPRTAHGLKGENKAAEMLSRLKHNNDKKSVASDTGLFEPGDRPCNKFRLDTTATEFGMCKCGYKRVDHLDQGENKAKKALEKLKSSNIEKYKNSTGQAGEACDNYRVDTSASEFGVCLCGFKKDDHVAKDENAAAKMLKNLKAKNMEKHMKEDMEAVGLSPEEDEAEAKRQEEEIAALNKAEQDAETKGKKKKGGKKGKKNGVCVVC